MWHCHNTYSPLTGTKCGVIRFYVGLTPHAIIWRPYGAWIDNNNMRCNKCNEQLPVGM